jgi:hypothetical protein
MTWRWYSLRGWALIGAFARAMIPVAATAYYIGLRIIAGRELLVIWPTSLGLMAAEAATRWIDQAIIWTVCAGLNVVLYSFVASMLYGVSRLGMARRLAFARRGHSTRALASRTGDQTVRTGYRVKGTRSESRGLAGVVGLGIGAQSTPAQTYVGPPLHRDRAQANA